VAGIVALMVQANPLLTAVEAELALELSAVPMAAGCRDVTDITGLPVTFCWDADATGSGLATAEGALAHVTAPSVRKPGRK
jgi:hypothetical protein